MDRDRVDAWVAGVDELLDGSSADRTLGPDAMRWTPEPPNERAAADGIVAASRDAVCDAYGIGPELRAAWEGLLEGGQSINQIRAAAGRSLTTLNAIHGGTWPPRCGQCFSPLDFVPGWPTADGERYDSDHTSWRVRFLDAWTRHWPRDRWWRPWARRMPRS